MGRVKGVCRSCRVDHVRVWERLGGCFVDEATCPWPRITLHHNNKPE